MNKISNDILAGIEIKRSKRERERERDRANLDG